MQKLKLGRHLLVQIKCRDIQDSSNNKALLSTAKCPTWNVFKKYCIVLNIHCLNVTTFTITLHAHVSHDWNNIDGSCHRIREIT